MSRSWLEWIRTLTPRNINQIQFLEGVLVKRSQNLMDKFSYVYSVEQGIIPITGSNGQNCLQDYLDRATGALNGLITVGS
jgi:hypothetical protein